MNRALSPVSSIKEAGNEIKRRGFVTIGELMPELMTEIRRAWEARHPGEDLPDYGYQPEESAA